MALPVDFGRRLRFIGQRIRESGAALQEEVNREYRKIAVETLEKHKSMTPRQPPRPDKEPSPSPLADGWRLVETGNIQSGTYSVAVVNVNDRPLTDKTGKVYRKANGQFFTVLDALDVGIKSHDIKYKHGPEGQEFYFWWEKKNRYFKGYHGKTVIVDHPGVEKKGVLRIPRTEAARKTRNLRRRIQRRLRRL